MKKMMFLVFLALIGFSCGPIMLRGHHSKIEIFPSQYASDADFINLVNDDRDEREQAHRHVFVYYNCLIQANVSSYKRQDPLIIIHSEVATFSEIPEKIYQTRLERLARVITEHNKAAIQSTVEREIAELKKINWNGIKKEVNLIVTGGRKAELDRQGCPLSEADLRGQRMERSRSFERPIFIFPSM